MNEESPKKITLNGVEYVRADSVSPAQNLGPLTLVRTYSAGVHIGELVSLEGKKAVLRNAVRLWRWRGANTLNEVAAGSFTRSEYTRISKPTPEITLTESIELIPVVNGADFSPVWNND